MAENKNYSDITQELTSNEDALSEELLSVEKKETKIKHISMKKSLLITCTAVVLIAALIICYFSFWKKGEKTDENVKVLYDYALTDISSIKLTNNVSNDVIDLTSFKNGSVQEWNIAGQKYDDVNQTNAKSVATFSAHLETKYVLPYSADKLSEYGLDAPTSVVEVTYADGSTNKISVGKAYGSSEGVYVLVEGFNEIYIVNDYVRIYFSFSLADLLNLPSLTKTSASAQSVSVITQDRTVTTISYIAHPLYGTEAWYLIAPTTSQTSSDGVDAFFENLSNVKLTSFYCEKAGNDISVYGFDKPVLEMQSLDGDAAILDHLIIGKKTEENADTYYCVLLGKDEKIEDATVYLIKEDQLALINANAVDLADPYLVALNIYWLRSGTIKLNGETYNITIDRQLQYDDDGKILYLEDGTENTKNTYYINGKKLDELQFKTFYSKMLFLYIEGIVPADTARGEELFSYNLKVVIPVANTETKELEYKDLTYEGTYYKVSETHAVFKNNESDNAVFTVRCRSIETIAEALNLLLEGRMPTA